MIIQKRQRQYTIIRRSGFEDKVEEMVQMAGLYWGQELNVTFAMAQINSGVTYDMTVNFPEDGLPERRLDIASDMFGSYGRFEKPAVFKIDLNLFSDDIPVLRRVLGPFIDLEVPYEANAFRVIVEDTCCDN